MGMFFEILMVLFLDAAMLMLALGCLREPAKRLSGTKRIAVTMGIGFVLGAVLGGTDGAWALTAMNAIGLILACAALVGAIHSSKKEKHS